MSLKEYGQLNGLLSMSVLSCILRKLIFTITERIVARWLAESYGLWEYRLWKWRNLSRSAGCFVFGFLPKKKCYWKNKSTTIFHGLHSYRPQKCLRLFSATTRLLLVVLLEFWTFHGAWNIVVDLLNNLQVKGGELPYERDRNACQKSRIKRRPKGDQSRGSSGFIWPQKENLLRHSIRALSFTDI